MLLNLRRLATFILVSAACLAGVGCRNAAAPGAHDAVGGEMRADAHAWTPEPGFTSLITGTDLSGWHYKGDPDLGAKTEATDGRYSAKDGMLVVNPEVPD